MSTGGFVTYIERMTDWEGRQVIAGFANDILDRLPEDAVLGPSDELWGSKDPALVGTWQGTPHVGGEVHVEDIHKFATSVGDNNPLWLDEDHARGTRWGGIIAPPTFVDRFTPFYVLDDDNNQGYLSGPTPIEVPFKGGFSAGDEVEVFRPVRPGDVIVATTTISDLFEKVDQPSTGRMLFVRYDKTYRNQRDDIVSICRWTSVKYESPVNGDQQEADTSVAPPYTSPVPDLSSLTTISERKEYWTTPVYFEDVSEGLELAPVSRLQTQKRFVRWAQASNDLSDIHYDVVIASESAQFGVPEIRNVGGFPGGGGIHRISRQLPYKAAMWMLLSGQFMTAAYMQSIGYVNEIMPEDKLIETAQRYAQILCENPPIGVQTAKEVAVRSLDLPIDHPATAWQYQWDGITARMRGSEDAKESRAAWLEKRKPVYHNR
jgi:acyl dehydratase